MQLTRRRFLGASAGVVAGIGLAPLLAGTRGAAAAGWVASAPPVPGLGFVTTLAVDPFDPAVLLAGGDVHGLKRTTDGGRRWEQIDSGTWKAGRYGISAITPHPAIKGRYYVLSGSSGSGGAVYRTDSSGDHWELLHQGIVTIPQAGDGVLRVYGRLLALQPGDASGDTDVLYAASYRDGVYKSVDSGRSWANTPFPGRNLTAVVLHPTRPATVYLGWRADTNDWSDTSGGVMVSTDGGASWSDMVTGIPVRDLVVDPGQTTSIYAAALTGGVWRKLAGTGWERVSSGLPMTTPGGGPVYFNAIEVNAGQVGQVLVGTGEGNVSGASGSIHLSNDRGGSWTDLVTSGSVHPDSTVLVPPFYYPGGGGYAASAVRVVPPSTIWVSGRSLVWSSRDGGADWLPSDAGMEGAGRHFDVAIDPTTGSLYMGTGDWALIRSDPARQTFALVPLTFPGGDVRSLCFAFTTSRLLLGAGSSKDVDAAGNNWGGIYSSVPGEGTSWKLHDTALPSARVVGLATAPSNPDVVYAALARNGVFRSTDGATTFQLMSTSGLPDAGTLFPGSFTKIPIVVHPHEPNALYLLDHVHGLFSYSPSTDAWTNVSAGVPVTGAPVDAGAPYQGFALDPLQPSRLSLATSAGLFQSLDAGSSWSQAAIPSTEGFGPVVADPASGTVFAATALPGESSLHGDQPGIYALTSGAAAWVGAYVDGPFAVNFDVLAIDPRRASTVWAASGGSLFSLTPA